jgi:putative ABC transport system substrate-binding protein
MFDVRRREFITLLGGAAAAWPLTARAQQRDRMNLVAVLAGGDGKVGNLTQIQNELEKLGWVVGRNIRFEGRYAIGDPERIRTFATELISQSPHVILAGTTPVLAAFQRLTHSIPIVFVNVSDPVRAGFVPSLTRQGGNITGFSNFEYAISAKWLEILKEAAPSIIRVGIVLGHNDPSWARYLAPIEAAAPAFGVQLSTILLEEQAASERAINAFARDPHGGLILLPNGRVTNQSEFLAVLAARLRLELRSKPQRGPIGRGCLCRPHPKRCQACGPAGRAVVKVRASHQPSTRPHARPYRAAVPALDCRRGDRMSERMKRREFITLVGGAAATWPLAARAQQGERVRPIGVTP